MTKSVQDLIKEAQIGKRYGIVTLKKAIRKLLRQRLMLPSEKPKLNSYKAISDGIIEFIQNISDERLSGIPDDFIEIYNTLIMAKSFQETELDHLNSYQIIDPLESNYYILPRSRQRMAMRLLLLKPNMTLKELSTEITKEFGPANSKHGVHDKGGPAGTHIHAIYRFFQLMKSEIEFLRMSNNRHFDPIREYNRKGKNKNDSEYRVRSKKAKEEERKSSQEGES